MDNQGQHAVDALYEGKVIPVGETMREGGNGRRMAPAGASASVVPAGGKSTSRPLPAATTAAPDATSKESRIAGEEMPHDEVIQTFLVDWEAEKAGEVKFKDGEDEKELVEKGKVLLRLFMEAMKDEAPQAVELPFTVDLVDPETGEVLPIRLKGIFDLVLSGDRVVEVKTAARAWDQDTLQRNLQLTAYHYAYQEMTGRAPTLEVVTLLKQKSPRLDLLPTVRTNKDHSWFVHLVEQVNRGIEKNVFPPNPGWPCAECEYASQCRGWRG